MFIYSIIHKDNGCFNSQRLSIMFNLSYSDVNKYRDYFNVIAIPFFILIIYYIKNEGKTPEFLQLSEDNAKKLIMVTALAGTLFSGFFTYNWMQNKSNKGSYVSGDLTAGSSATAQSSPLLQQAQQMPPMPPMQSKSS